MSPPSMRLTRRLLRVSGLRPRQPTVLRRRDRAFKVKFVGEASDDCLPTHGSNRHVHP